MGAFDAYIRLDGSLKGSISCDEPLSKHTTYRIGGPAALYVKCASLADLSLVLDVLAEEEVPWTVVGKGSNLLVSDEGYDGAVLVLDGEFGRMDFGGYSADDPFDLENPREVIASAGASVALSLLVQKAFNLALAGLEFAVGTPGTLGGALCMNAGTRDTWIGSIVDSVTTYVPGEGLRIRRGHEIPWSYRSSGIPSNEVIVEASLRLRQADKMMLRAGMEASLNRRKASQPLNQPSCGSVFRNPEGMSAGQLIADCGLQGMKVGGAQISEKHANFIINTGSAKASDVAELIRTASDRVREVHGIELIPEVRFVGFPS